MSIHNHVNSVKSLLCVPSLVHVDLSEQRGIKDGEEEGGDGEEGWGWGGEGERRWGWGGEGGKRRDGRRMGGEKGVGDNTMSSIPSAFEPHQGILIGPSGPNQMKAALFIVSFGEGHLDLRTADKILQALHTKDPLHSGLPSPTSIISEKNYIMVWDIVP